MHDLGLIQKYSLNYNVAVAATRALFSSSSRAGHPGPNAPLASDGGGAAEVPFICHPDNLFFSLMFVMATETDMDC